MHKLLTSCFTPFSVRCVKNKFSHFARQLQKTMKGLGTDDDTLVRVVVSRCEIDMVQIKEEFEKLTGQTLQQYIAVSSNERNCEKICPLGSQPCLTQTRLYSYRRGLEA